MKKLTKSFLTLMLGVCCSNVYAGTGWGKVTRIQPVLADTVIFTVENHVTMPSCSNQGLDWALSLTTNTGRAQYSLLLAAAAQKKSVSITGFHDCRAWGDREAPYFIIMDY